MWTSKFQIFDDTTIVFFSEISEIDLNTVPGLTEHAEHDSVGFNALLWRILGEKLKFHFFTRLARTRSSTLTTLATVHTVAAAKN